MITSDETSDSMEAKRLNLGAEQGKAGDSLSLVGQVPNSVNDSTAYDADSDATRMIHASIEVLIAALQTIAYDEDVRCTWHAVAPLEAAAMRCVEAMALCWYHCPDATHSEPPKALHPPGTKLLDKLLRLGIQDFKEKAEVRHVAVVPSSPQNDPLGQTEDVGLLS
jgi:hypothetical protein